jgi:uroporphyrinogen-III synthase
MSKALENRTVAITEHRFEKELMSLIERHGARVISCPLLEERPVENRSELRFFIRQIIEEEFDYLVFFTGVGARFIGEEAESMGQSDEFKEALKRTKVVARGPKPRAAMGKLGLSVDLAPEKATSEGLLELFQAQQLEGKRIGVQLYGSPNPDFVSGLEALGAVVSIVQVYNYGPASDTSRVLTFIETLLSGEVDAITFTSGPQIDSIFATAETSGRADALCVAFNDRISVAVVGEVTGRALVRRGVVARILPPAPKMAPLADAIATYFEHTNR